MSDEYEDAVAFTLDITASVKGTSIGFCFSIRTTPDVINSVLTSQEVVTAFGAAFGELSKIAKA